MAPQAAKALSSPIPTNNGRMPPEVLRKKRLRHVDFDDEERVVHCQASPVSAAETSVTFVCGGTKVRIASVPTAEEASAACDELFKAIKWVMGLPKQV